jgi:hypothetical protein
MMLLSVEYPQKHRPRLNQGAFSLAMAFLPIFQTIAEGVLHLTRLAPSIY